MAYSKKPTYSFPDINSTGINKIPQGRIITVDDYFSGKPKMFLTNNLQSLSDRSTISDAINQGLLIENVVSDEYSPYLILKSSPLSQKQFTLNDGANQSNIDAVVKEVNKYRVSRIIINGTVTGDIILSQVNYCEIIFNWETSAKLVGNLIVHFNSNIRIIRLTIENGQLIVSRFSKCYLLSNITITAPSGKSAIDISADSTIFTDQTTGYPVKPINLTSDSIGIGIVDGSSFIAGRGLTINTTNTTTKISLARGSFASLDGTTLSGDGTDFNIAANTITANGIIMR